MLNEVLLLEEFQQKKLSVSINSTYSEDMLISGASKQISPDPPMIFVAFIRLKEETGRSGTIYTMTNNNSAPQVVVHN